MWEVNFDGELYNPFDERLDQFQTLCCYFNIGIDGEIGARNLYLVFRAFLQTLKGPDQDLDVAIYGCISIGEP